ncbi:MAG: hypothetical protein J6U04_04310 [Salinivirgaceae bacterium]|nr:hypothetical protein [Salinivirgaceae bacterium]
MRVLLLFGILIASLAAPAQSSADAEMKRLVNYWRMTEKNKATFKKQYESRTAKWTEDSIPANFRIPTELISFRNGTTRYYAFYNVKYKMGIGYVPSDLVALYEQEAWRAYKKYGVDAPSLSIVLAQQFTESAFNPYITGDQGRSIGLPQLFRKTARMLYQTDRETWRHYFAFKRNGEHYFLSNRMQVRFPFEFLPNVKGYDAEHKLDGLKNYNGFGEEAFAYAEKVMKRSLMYEELFAKYNPVELDTTNYRENLFGLINMSLLCHNLPELPESTMDQMFKNIISGIDNGRIRKSFVERYYVNVMESDPLSIDSKVEFIVPATEQDFYLLIEDGHTLYSYFADNQQMLDVINNPQNSRYYLYYKQGRKIVKIDSYKGVGNRTIFSNVKPGDKIFIPPGTVLKSTDNNLMLIIR